jgi:Domain of unknown function (DUF222)/HNH endonuclease
MCETGNPEVTPLGAAQMVTSGLAVLCQADASGLDAGTMAELLLVLEQADTMAAAARASILGAFTATLGYEGDGHAGPVPWLMDQAQTTRGRAKSQVSQGKKLRQHRLVAQAMAAGAVMGSWADKIMEWTDRLPADSRDAADEILLGAAAGGARLEDLAALACTMYEQSRQDTPDDDGPVDPSLLDPEAAAFADRALKLETTLDGAGTLHGDLSAECTGMLATVLDALSVRAGDVDDRTYAQRYHDGLTEACRRLIAAGLIPQRAGQPTKAIVHIPFGQLRQMDGGSVFEQAWRGWAVAEWAAHRGAVTVLGNDGAVWLDGSAAEAAGCDAMTVPVVFGSIDWQAMDHMVEECAELHGIRHGRGRTEGQDGTDAREAELRDSILGTILDVVSGPGAAASVLRTGLLSSTTLGSPSQVLDIGYSQEIPAAIRRAVTLRDKHCAFGKCTMLPQFCEVHHIIHKEDGGPTCVSNCVLLCWYHHQVLIHRKGWKIRLLSDGTTEATSPTGKTVRSHGPPARAG